MLHILHLSSQPKPGHVPDRIPRQLKPKLKLLALLVLSVLGGNRNGPGVPIYPNILVVSANLSIPLVVPDPNIPLVVQMPNLTTKRKTMLNSLSLNYSM